MDDRVLAACRDAIEAFAKRGLPIPLGITLSSSVKPRLEFEVAQLDTFPFANPGIPSEPKILGVPIRFEAPPLPGESNARIIAGPHKETR
jgi:hypothetical protein